jgi:two-component system LytT family sensor kinase
VGLAGLTQRTLSLAVVLLPVPSRNPASGAVTAAAPPTRRPTRWLWIAAIWCAGALIDASQTLLIMHAEGRPKPWLPLFATEFVSWLPWALATPLIMALARRFPLVRGDLLKAAAVHLTALAR